MRFYEYLALPVSGNYFLKVSMSQNDNNEI